MAIWDEYVILSEGLCNWEELVERYGIHTLMLEPENQAGLIHAARNSPAWEEVYQDEYTVILTRRSP
jgi:hypothetical protein